MRILNETDVDITLEYQDTDPENEQELTKTVVLPKGALLGRHFTAKQTEEVLMKAVALCFKPYLKPEEAMIYLNIKATRLAKRCEEYGIFKNASGYYSRADLDLILSGGPTKYEIQIKQEAEQKRRR